MTAARVAGAARAEARDYSPHRTLSFRVEFAESSTMGTILVLVVYLLANLALPFYYRRFRPQEFSAVKHGVLPVLGAIAIIVPLYYLAKPGQPTPYDWFPYAALIIVVVGAVYAYVLNSRDPGLAARVGSIVADE